MVEQAEIRQPRYRGCQSRGGTPLDGAPLVTAIDELSLVVPQRIPGEEVAGCLSAHPVAQLSGSLRQYVLRRAFAAGDHL